MDKNQFSVTLSRLYALFGKGAVPQPVYNELWRRVEEYPDGVLPLVEARLETSERLPANLYREFHAAWESWKERNPQQVVRTHCPDCGDKAGFWCWVKDDAGTWTQFFSACPYCQNGGGRTYPTPQELRARGVEIMPLDYKGGPTAFDRDRGFGVLWPTGMEPSPQSRDAVRVGVPMSPDPQRFAALPEQEREDLDAVASW